MTGREVKCETVCVWQTFLLLVVPNRVAVCALPFICRYENEEPHTQKKILLCYDYGDCLCSMPIPICACTGMRFRTLPRFLSSYFLRNGEKAAFLRRLKVFRCELILLFFSSSGKSVPLWCTIKYCMKCMHASACRCLLLPPKKVFFLLNLVAELNVQ